MYFDSIDYLKTGTIRQQKAYKVLNDYSILEKLYSFTPLLTGTIPINIDIPESDLDIICYWKNENDFCSFCQLEFSSFHNYDLSSRKTNTYQTIVVNFQIDDFQVEIFGQNRPTKEQEAYLHMLVEYEILKSKGEPFRQEIIKLKKEGLKTEPAFAKLLGLTGDPYQTLLNYKV